MYLKLHKSLKKLIFSPLIAVTSLATATELPPGGDINGTYQLSTDYVGGHDHASNQLNLSGDTIIESASSAVNVTLGGTSSSPVNFKPLIASDPKAILIIRNLNDFVWHTQITLTNPVIMMLLLVI